MALTPAPAGVDFGLAWPRPLFRYQVDGVHALLAHPSLLLADEMGFGKTIQAIAALRGLFASVGAQAALVVAPIGLILQWRRELRQWAPELRLSTILGPPRARTGLWRAPGAQVFLCGYETVRIDRYDPAVGGREWDVIILDEAQRIKNPHTEMLFGDVVEGVSIRHVRRLDLPTLLQAIHSSRAEQASISLV